MVMGGGVLSHDSLLLFKSQRQILCDLTYTWELKRNDASEPVYKIEMDPDLENKLTVPKGDSRWGGGR